MSFHRDTIRTARKEHKCGLCHGVIKAGEKYHDKASNSANNNNDVYWARECEPCQLVIGEFVQSDYFDFNEGYCDEAIMVWWRDVKCPDCKHYYLLCVPDDGCKEFHLQPDGSCPERTKYNTCQAGETCDEMTLYCRCDRFEPAEVKK